MSRSLRRGALAATAIVISIASLSACGAGNDAQTLEVKPDNAAVTVEDVQIQNALVITQPEAGAKGPAVVSATVFNNGSTSQTIDSITLPRTTAVVKLKPATGAGPIVVPAGGSVVIGGKGNASAVIASGIGDRRNGDALRVVFSLSKTGEVGLQAFVVPAQSYFKEFGPSEIPAPPAAKPAEKPAEKPSGEASAPAGEASGAPETGEPTGEATHAAGH
ncbi:MULTISPECIES: DUF461 domain-containing protein [Streptomyces]|uniref:DUF461 domain-containing protein n=1 Tax=Streptomyces solicathayae TaxID=3081768 RepID=A0ABZ0LVN8_9ACTN|nr:DUF461 domain-containing protein [Streptomyces sp. HUAS YS2]WOX23576.1 DUF461 domain-containing protein [Streptomyces sp. HUAS YS2]